MRLVSVAAIIWWGLTTITRLLWAVRAILVSVVPGVLLIAGTDQARIAHLSAQLSDLLARSGQYQPVSAAAPTDAALRSCGGCDVDLARKLGARVSVVGWVQKVSNLILNINIVIRDVATDKMIHAGSVDIRGDTDESWSRGLAYLVQNRILAPAEPAK